jgi:hypothetical protein
MEIDEKRCVGHDEYRDSENVDLKGVPDDKIAVYCTFAKKDETWRRKRLLHRPHHAHQLVLYESRFGTSYCMVLLWQLTR